MLSITVRPTLRLVTVPPIKPICRYDQCFFPSKNIKNHNAKLTAKAGVAYEPLMGIWVICRVVIWRESLC